MRIYLLAFTLLSIATLTKGQNSTDVAQVFEPGVISLAETWEEYITFSPDGNQLAFNRRGKNLDHKGFRIYISQKENGKWSNPVLAPFSKNPFQDRSPQFSPDGNRIYFSSNRPLGLSTDDLPKSSDIWYSERTKNGWSEPVWLGEDINLLEENEVHPTLAKSGNLYFVRWGSTETDIYFSSKNGETYSEPIKMDQSINGDGPDSHPYVDPDERFLIYTPTDRQDGYGGGDIYISYPSRNGTWKKSVNIGNTVNTEWYEYSAKVSGDYLYFTRAGFGNPANKPADIYFIKLEKIGIELD
ncbi:TolB family protein [Ekhidna sp.]